MSTNYYFKDIHIGKSSAGWAFALRIYPERNITTLRDWHNYITNNTPWYNKMNLVPGPIHDEYGERISLAALEQIIKHRFGRRNPSNTTPEYLQQNHAVFGPHGLLRAKLGNDVVGHGEGSWDYIDREFS